MFVICYEKNEDRWRLSHQVRERSIPSDLVLSEKGDALYVGCCFDATSEELFSSGWESDPSVLNTFCSALYIVRFEADRCVFATDTTGRELLFYYFDGTRLVLSDSFWGILKIVQPSYGDVDWGVVAELMASGGGVPCDLATPVKHLRWLAPNTICTFDAMTGTFSEREFADVRRTGQVTSMDEAVDALDASMTHMARCLASRHEGAVFALGLSGGLDSRTALHYLAQEGITPSCFNVCVRRPHKLLLASSVVKERGLARAASISCSEVQWRPEGIARKCELMLRANPLGSCGHFTNAYKYEDEGMPSFDVLVTAGQAIGPGLVGGSASKDSDRMTRQQVFDYLAELNVCEVQPFAYTQGLLNAKAKAMGLPFVKDQGPHEDVWATIVTKDTLSAIHDKVGRFVDERLSRGFRPADVINDYRTSVYGPIGRNGAYESRFGTAKSYTIYTPFLVKDGLSWDIPLIEERAVLKELIARKMPEFAGIGEETYGSTKGESSKLGLLVDKLSFLLRGSGIMAAEWYARHPAIRTAFLNDMGNGMAWFYEAFPAARDFNLVYEMSPSRMNAIWEVKRLVDCIESKSYLEFE